MSQINPLHESLRAATVTPAPATPSDYTTTTAHLQPTTEALLGSSIPMEVEIKLRLPDAAAHRRLSSFLAPHLRRTHAQRNLFFDTAARAPPL